MISEMGDSLNNFIASLETERGCSRKECLPLEAHRLASTASSLFKRIVENMQNFREESGPYTGIGRPSLGWAHGAFRDALRIIDLTVDALCAGLGIHVPRDRSVGVRKSIAVFLLKAVPECEPRAMGELRSGRRDVPETQSIRLGRHAMLGGVAPDVTAEDLIWLRRRVKYPGADIPHDELYLEMERALRLARIVHAALLHMFENGVIRG